MTECMFCKIIEGEIPANKVYEDDIVLAFRDTNPQAPTHILVIPKMHADNLDDAPPDLATRCLEAIPNIAHAEGLTNGYRVVSNVGEDGGQTVFHLHFHVLGGKRLKDGLG